ncbi:type IV toxin-antitoxin system AbiEi family antitoxin [Pseudarthrobacter sp. NPDC092439]|uniref:type IV toxin-antitoxin system AbiEi family antitoxin n=1 Tax=unclassified Pseudarthrobacter TaxID=2647000 RepID=UPI0038260CB9
MNGGCLLKKMVARDLSQRLKEYGLGFAGQVDLGELSAWDAVKTLLVSAKERAEAEFTVVYAPAPTEAALMSSGLERYSPDWPQVLLVGPRVTERSAERFRATGVNYLDAAGNAFIVFDGVRIDVRGRRADPALNAADTGLGAVLSGPKAIASLFTAKRAQVIFALLSWEELLSGTVRDIADAAGVSVGQAQTTLKLLEQTGFLHGRRWANPHERDSLIDQWTATYPLSLGALSSAKRFSGDFTDLEAADRPVYISGEAAVPEVLRGAQSVVLYSPETPTELIRRGRWRRDEENPTIFLRKQFWNPPASESTAPGRRMPEIRRAPWLLVYADLMASGDGRLREAAQQFRASQ